MKLSWLKCSSPAGIRESVLLFPRIQMVSCTGPQALGDKWQNSTFHLLPSLYLSAVHIRTESLRKAQLDIWMWAALDFILVHSAQPSIHSATAYVCARSSQVEIQLLKSTSWQIATNNYWQLQNSDCELMGSLNAGVPQEEQVYPPKHMGALRKNLQCSFCSIPQPMGCPIKASHPAN